MIEHSEDVTYLRKGFHVLVLCLLFVGALAIRLYRIQDPPMGFAPKVQYRSAAMARARFYEGREDIPQWKKSMALIEDKKLGLREPPLMENAAVLLYRIAGREILWLPRSLSIIFWVLAGLFIYLVSAHLVSRSGALISTMFFLYAPFGIDASRSFQPDPLLILGFTSALYLILRFHESPKLLRLLIAALVTALAVFVKGITVFCFAGFYLGLLLARQNVREALHDWKNYLFAAITMLPFLMYYPYHIFVAKDLPTGYFYPHLFLKKYFWKG